MLSPPYGGLFKNVVNLMLKLRLWFFIDLDFL
jgi:hypothetical protein